MMKKKKRKPSLTIRTWKLGPFNTQSVKLYPEQEELQVPLAPPKQLTQAQQIARDLISRTVLPKGLREKGKLPHWRRKKESGGRTK